jgi:hypothetical protein
MKLIHFFALKDDLLPMLEAVECDDPLKYVRTGNCLSPDFNEFLNGADIPTLGKASAESAIGCESFLVTPRTLPVILRPIKATGGTERYCMDQLINPDTVEFIPAGVWSDEIVLNGRVGTVSDSAVSQELMKRFNSAIRKQFTKIKAFWVGANALTLLNAGKRLAGAAQSPREFDLTTGP